MQFQVIAGIKKTIIVKPKLTIKALAEKLKEIEKQDGYEMALLGIESLNYLELCKLARSGLRKENPIEANDPHWMPSRFMLLEGVTDKGLEAKGNLDAYPYELHPSCPHTFSVSSLSQCLCWYYSSGKASDIFDDKIRIAFERYLSENQSFNTSENQAAVHIVQKGESLSRISNFYGIADWHLLYQKNENVIGDNPDLIKIGQQLEIPSTKESSLKAWLRGLDAEAYYSENETESKLKYRYPWKLLSISLCDKDEKPLPDFTEEKTFEVYQTHGDAVIVLSCLVKSFDEIDIVIPDLPDLIEMRI